MAAAKEKSPSRLSAWFAPILFLLVAVAAAAPASASMTRALETRAWEKTSSPLDSRLDESLQLLNLHQQNATVGYDSVLGSPLAAETTSGIPNTFNLGSLQAEGFSAPDVFTNEQGFLSNGDYNLDAIGQAPHQTGSLVAGKSQFFYNLNSDQLVLDAASYADQQGAWTLSNGSKATISFDQPIGVDANTGLPTNNLNLYRTSTGFVHGSPGSP